MTNLKNELKQEGQSALDELHNAGESIKGAVKEKVQQASDAVADKTKQIKETACEAQDSLIKYCQEKPLKAAAIALVSGFILAKLFNK